MDWPRLIILTSTWSSMWSSVLSESVISSPRVTDWGDWGSWEYCPSGTYATGIQLRTHSEQGFFIDDRGLTGIRLLCNPYSLHNDVHSITSSVDNVGDWGREYFCSGAMVGFQMRSEMYQTILIDDTAANNLRMFCNDGSQREGDGTNFGRWTQEKFCGPREVICGIRTQVDHSDSWDSTGLNNVMMRCCDVPHPLTKCTPVTTWEPVVSCDATSVVKKSCRYSKKIGVSYLEKGDYYAQLLLENFGYARAKMALQMHGRFLEIAHSAPAGSKESYWETFPQYVWDSKTVNKQVNLTAKNSKISLYQLHGRCGPFQVWGTKLKKVFIGLDGFNVTTYIDFTNDNAGLDYDY